MIISADKHLQVEITPNLSFIILYSFNLNIFQHRGMTFPWLSRTDLKHIDTPMLY